MNNNANGNVYGICMTCKRTIVVNPAYSYGYCPVCRRRYGTKYAIEAYNRTMGRARQIQLVQQRSYNQNVMNSVNYSEPEQEYSSDDVNTAALNKKSDRMIIIATICILLLIIVVALISSYAEKKNTQNRVNEKINANSVSLHEGEIHMTESHADFIGRNYKDVIKQLKDYGFTNISTSESETQNPSDVDLVDSVSINGINMFKDKWYSPDVKVNVRYKKMAVITTKVTTAQVTTTTAVETTVVMTEPTAPPQPQGVTPEFKQLMDNYEAFFDEYISFMERLGNDSDSDDLSALGDYFSMLEKEAKMLEEMEAIDEKELSAADDAYYIEVTARIYQKLMKVAFSLY